MEPLSSAILPNGLFDSGILDQLPGDLVASLRASSSSDAYLDTLAVAALDITCDVHLTARIFALYEPVFVDLAARWLSLSHERPDKFSLRVVSAFSRILPFAEYLRSFAREAIRPEKGPVDVTTLDDDLKLHYLLALFRLLSLDPEFFTAAVVPNTLLSLFHHEQAVIRYLAIRCFTLQVRAADAATQDIISRYTGTGAIEGLWEDRTIDYRFLSLWEERRWMNIEEDLQKVRDARDDQVFRDWISQLRHVLNARTAEVGGVIVPATRARAPDSADAVSLVRTPTVSSNLQNLGHALLSNDPILLCGLPGSGKTTLVNSAANAVGQSKSMITLHLNEQTDSKSLLGVYSTSAQVGSFTWQPGVLAQAAKEGRWVLIEDLDRAPAEVLGLILPLIEKRELVIPSRKETIQCAEGFRVLATMRTMINARGEENVPGTNMLGNRLWKRIPVKNLPLSEVEVIIREKFPLLLARATTIIAMFERIGNLVHGDLARKSLQGRTPGLRDLIKFCSRVQRRLELLGCVTGNEPVPESLDDKIFMDAVDCFASYLPVGVSKDTLCGVIAQELQLSPQRSHFCLNEQTPKYENATDKLTVGREVCRKRKSLGRKAGAKKGIFAPTRPSLRTMEQIASALQLSEPLLLVGETGIGKTAVIQQLASLLNQRLTVVNLSQQSETTDLLGGFKPVNLRTLAVPLVDEFNELFDVTFSAKKNQKFLNSVKKAVTNGNWPRLLTFLKEAIKMASNVFAKKTAKHNQDASDEGQEQPSKKRRFDEPKYVALREKWEAFERDLSEFEARSAQGDSGFAFAFVQGKIVKALRDGDWVLLDEINLASPDTLESIASLLNHGPDGSPSLLLSEAGEVERIYGHPQFRIFGAMNPATDAGKRDLAPGLRSRFTEIYVNSPDTDIDDLIGLIDAYLGPLTASDLTASAALAQLYLETKQLNIQNRLTDGAGQKPHFSIRTLVRTLVYVRDQAQVYGLRRAIYEGFCMSFLTLLSKDSEALIMPLLDQHIFSNLKNARSILSQTPKAPEDGQIYVRYKHYWMRQGAFSPEKQPHYIITPFIERNLMNLVRASSTRRFPILLQGPTSAGKTSMVEYLANVSGNRFVRINNHEHTDLQEYLGTYISGEDGRLVYQEGVLVEALRNGYWIVLDELNLAPTDVLEALNRLLDDNRELFLPESQEIVRPHPNFMLFATQNPAGLYGGRKILSRAFRNRFLELHFDDIPEDELEYILRERSQIAPSFCTRIVSVYKRLSLLRQSSRLFEQRNSFATLRDLFRWALRKADNREQLAINGFMLLAERVRNSHEREAVKKVIEEVMKVKLDLNTIYSAANLDSRLQQAGLALPTGLIWTPAMRRVFLLVSHAIENNEPVLLVGETGCGKTQICQAIAEAYRRHLYVINAHVNLETGDLIGAQRPVRNRAAIENQLVSDLMNVLSQQAPLENLLSQFSKLEPQQLEQMDHEILDRIKTNAIKAKSLFQWSNGSLITAMESGQHFLLDEISLADDSVLERLNSVLEPHRSILLAENGPVDSMIVAKDGFQFLATMNPGGDYGKRELSAALRNRLTEIWVPQLSEADDILPILARKLERSGPKVPEAMLAFAKWFKTRFQGSSTGSMSIRDLLSWVNFVNTCNTLDLNAALIHGAALVYIDTLGANPSALLAASTGSLKNDRMESLKKLGELFSFNAVDIYYQHAELSVGFDSMKIGPFSLQLGNDSMEDPAFALDAPTTLSNVLRIARGLQSAKPILLEGSPGVGKTTLVATLAQVLGKPLTRINLSEQTDLTDLFGSDVPVEGSEMGNFAWSDAPFLRALQNGGWVLLDEMNLASQSVLEGLNSCLDHRQEVYIAELDQTFRRHEDFVLFAAQNPHHQGGGRKGLPASFVNRFTVVYADSFSDHDLKMICRKISPVAPQQEIDKMVGFISVLNLAINERRMGLVGGPWEINLRDISRWLKLLEKTQVRVQPYQFLDVVISHRFRTAGDRKEIFRRYHDVFSDAPDPKSYFHNLGIDHLQVGLGTLQRNRLLQDAYDSKTQLCKHELAIMESLILCIEQGWPSILVGPSGCGKTRLLRKLAAINGTKLVELSLNADTDTMDLIGGFEQADNQRHVLVFMEGLVNFIRERILECLATSQDDLALDLVQLLGIVHENPFGLDIISELLARVAAYTGSQDYEHMSQKCAKLYETSTAPSRIAFEWTEGMFIQAIQQGHWVVLDNANLCNPSVLDRLNSLMEPNGSLIISEQRTSDGSARIVTPHHNFRLFLTLDPRHGELSRAMRNRAIEICFLAEEQTMLSVPSSIVYGTESSIYRMRSCHDLALNKIVSEEPQFTFEVMLDHISHVDIGSINKSPENEYLFESSQTNEYPQTMERYSSLNTSFYKPVQVFTADSEVIEASPQPVVNLLSCFLTDNHWQPLNLLVNEPRLQANFLESDKDHIMALMKLQELQLDVHKFHQTLVSVSEGAFVKKPSEMTRLERSMASGRIASLKKDSTHVVSSFLLHCCQAISDWIQSAAQSDIGETVSVPRFILNFAWDLFKLLQKPVFDEGIFQAYLQTTWAWIVKHRDVQTKLMKFFSCSLGTFNSDWGLSTGKSMQRLWSEWRPVTPNGPSQLFLLSKLQSISARFDKISLNTRLPLERLAQLRSSLLESQRAILLGATGDELIQNLDTVISDLEHHILGFNTVSGPYFSEEFEALCQYNSMSGTPQSALSEVMHLLAGRPSRLPEFSNLGNSVPSLLSTLSSFAGFKSPHRKCLALQGTLPISTIGKILSVEDVPLKAMNLLEAETEALLRAISSSTAVISSSQVLFLQKALQTLLSELITSHKDVFTPDSFSMTLSQLQDILDAQPLRLQASSDYDDQPYAHHLSQVFATCHESISNLSVLDSDCISRSGVACIQLAVACLRLFIPDKPLDPSLNLVVYREQFESRLLEKTRRMESLRSFEKRFTGCDTNSRIRTAQNELRLLGDFPPEPPVVRPQPSQLIELQGEFSNILNTVLISDLDQPLSSSLSSAELLRKNIKQVCHRLTNNYGAYGDIVALAVQFLELLDLGISLIQQPNGVSNTSSNYLQEISKITPLLSYSSLSVANFDKSVSGPQISHNVEIYVHRISVLSVLQNADSTILAQQNYRRVLRENLNRLYAIWKEKLNADQEKEAEKSKTYRYRGNFEDEEQVDADELHRLFPTYEAEGDAEASDSRSTAFDVSSLAQRLFDAVKALFTKTDIELQVRQVIRDSFRLVGSVLRKSSLPYRHSEPSTYLPGVLLLLAEKSSTQGSLYNFYTDMNTLEIKKLAALVEKIQLRFSELQNLWPEHAALSDVLTCCSEIYDFRHRDPLAKFITKVEKLHGLVYLWQLVASKQYSAADLYDDLTALLISWRRIELSTWARLFDIEKENFEKDAAAWWFIAYEVIIEAPLQIVLDGGDLSNHCFHLVSTLERFLSSTSHGQYSARMRLIEQFRKLLDLYIEDYPSLDLVRSSLDNLYSHYSAFIPVIEKLLADGRSSLEKEVQEVIKLASWKDTNIAALRDSAKRSHHKLFKYIRKYRELLLQTSEGVISSGSAEGSNMPGSYTEGILTLDLTPVLSSWLSICSSQISSWADRPVRFHEPFNTSTSMNRVYNSAVNAMELSPEIASFLSDVLDSINDFKARTPKTLTEENRAEVQHLKTLKRRFFADKLKALRLMGVRSNLTIDILEKQGSTASILSSSPNLRTPRNVPFTTADNYFHRLLDIVPRVRVASRDYADDLSNAEVARSAGSVEGMLYWIIKQREIVAPHLEQVNSLTSSVEMILNICQSPPGELCAVTQTSQYPASIQGAVRWLATVLGISNSVLRIHANFSERNHSLVEEQLESLQKNLLASFNALNGFASLPRGVSSQAREHTCNAALAVVEVTRGEIKTLLETQPELAFVLRSVLPYASIEIPQMTHFAHHSTISLDEFDRSVTRVADKIFVCLQRISQLSTPISTETPSWLLKSDQLLAKSMAELHMAEISSDLDHVLNYLCELAKDPHQLMIASALLASVAPIVQQYRHISVDLVGRYVNFNRELSKMAYLLAKSFTQIASEGFCSPAEKSEDPSNSDKVESGTGLGEGEGAEDISKDVQDDEDLSDLAQEKQKAEGNQEGPDDENEDAVNMDQEELEADASDFETENEEEGEDMSGDEEDNDIDEESGSVDNLDADAVDEKMWDGAKDEEQKDVKNDKGEGTKQSDDKTTAADQKKDEDKEHPADEDGDEGEEEDAPEDEDEAVGGPEDSERANPHAQDEQVLNLPEDMDLDGQDEGKDDVESDDGMDEMSDIDDPLDQQNGPEQQEEEMPEASPDQADGADQTEKTVDEEVPEEENEGGADADVEADNEMQEDKKDDTVLQAETEDQPADQENAAPSEAVSGGLGTDQDQNEEKGTSGDAAQNKGVKDENENPEEQAGKAREGEEGTELSKEAGGRDDQTFDAKSEQAFQKLGDILEQWHKRQREIQQASEDNAAPREQDEDINMQEVDFEHLANEDDTADTQALGQASEEQAKGLDQRKAVESEEKPEDENVMPLPDESESAPEEPTLEDRMEIDQPVGPVSNKPTSSFIAGENKNEGAQSGEGKQAQDLEDLEDVDASLSALHVSSEELIPAEEARRLWSHYESSTHDLSLSLTEQLRLILAPTMATKLRGDFRTGKRLNIKRIIPYIASQFKRDKIWMRRSVPSKRSYQIMLAVDDSKSMQESGSGQLAFETLALVAKSLSMLEVGDLCVVSFGNQDHVRVAHEFGKPFSSEAGTQIFQQFSFKQTGTNVRQLIADSIALFRDAKNQRSRGSGSADLWQLQLIISDGICEDHDTIRRLVRQAQEERIMIVFVIVDAVRGSSILDLTQARFEPDTAGTGEMKLKMTRYLEGFPFAYYLVVRDVQELPAVLSLALKQWFAEVVDISA